MLASTGMSRTQHGVSEHFSSASDWPELIEVKNIPYRVHRVAGMDTKQNLPIII
jgi:hypothetical protein